MRHQRIRGGFAAALALLLIAIAGSGAEGTAVVTTPPVDCITGTSTAELVNHELGRYRYTIQVDWNTGTQHALSHLDLILGLGGCGCVCEHFSFGAPDTAGTSNGWLSKRNCTVSYEAGFECNGDPSIPGDEGPLVKWEPKSDPFDCEPGNYGSGSFVFYSDWAPAPVDSGNCYLLIKYATQNCCGELTGVLPECTCVTSVENQSWGGVKKLFR
ncbi:MAG: hypothetical protein JW958_10135 [Candidatus Eisenbacteria bacterium]|nr:hypothetical protein [Candidatus Eisenbacteria bacterium]